MPNRQDHIISKKTVKVALFILIILAIQLFLADCLLDLPHYFDASKIADFDYAYHLYHALVVPEFLKTFYHGWAYSPFHNLGYPVGTYNDPDDKAWERWIFLLFFLDKNLSFKLYIFLILLIAPFFIYLAGLNFRLSHKEAALATLTAALYPFFSILFSFLFWGLVSYFAITYFFVFLLSLLHRMLESSNTGDNKKFILYWLAWTLFASLGVMIHPFFLMPLMVVPGIILILCWWFRKRSLKPILWFFLSLVIIFLINLEWLYPLLKFNDPKTNFVRLYFQNKDPYKPLKVFFLQEPTFENCTPEKKPVNDLLFFLFGLSGAGILIRRKQTIEGITLAGGSLGLLIIAYYSGLVSFLEQFQLQRLITGANLLFALSAGVSLKFILDYLVKKSAWSLRFVVLGLVSLAIYYSLPVASETTEKGLKHLIPNLELRTSPFIELFKKYTDLSGRIWLEGSEWPSGIRYARAHLTWFFPYQLKRFYLTYPHPYARTRYSSARLVEGYLDDVPLSKIPPEKMWQYIVEHNVMWVLCWSYELKKYLDSFPNYAQLEAEIKTDFELPGAIDSVFFLYRIKRQPTFFLVGKGQLVSADYNKLVFTEVEPEEDRVVLSFHWISTLTTGLPEVAIQPIKIATDATPLIEVLHPPRELIIYNNY